MKIKRTVYHKEGDKNIKQEVEFELTPEELNQAYEEKQSYFDFQDVANVFDELTDEECQESYGITKDDASVLYQEMASEMRRNIHKYDMHWDSARDEAISMIISRHNTHKVAEAEG